MDLSLSLSDQLLYCSCRNSFSCPEHLSQHYNFQPSEDTEKLAPEVDSNLINNFKAELTLRIKSFSRLKKIVSLKTKNLIVSIESYSQSLLASIEKEKQKLIDLMNKIKFKTSEIQYMHKTCSSKMILKEFSFDCLKESLQKMFKTKLDDILTFRPNEISMKKFLKNHNSKLYCIELTSDGETLVTGSEDTSVRLWNTNSKKQIACLLKHDQYVWCLAISKSNSLIASGSGDRTVILWDLHQKSFIKVFRGHSDEVLTVKFSNDSSFILSGSESKEIIIWKTDSAEIIKKIVTRCGVYCGVFNNKNLFYAGIGKNIEIMDLINYKSLRLIKAHKEKIRSIALTKNEKFIITGSDDSLIKIWNSKTLVLQGSLNGHRSLVLMVSVTFDGKHIVSCSADNLIILWKIQSLSILHKFEIHSDFVQGIAISNDFIYSASLDKTIGAFRISTKSFESFFHSHKFDYETLSIKNRLAAFGDGTEVYVCDFNNSQIHHLFQGHLNHIKATCISSETNFLVSASYGKDKNLIVWDLKQKSIRHILIGHKHQVNCIDISNDEKLCISGDKLGILYIWDLQNNNIEFEFKDHLSDIYSVKFSLNSRFAASVGEDKMLRIWDIEKKFLYARLKGHDNIISKVIITSNDKYFVTASWKDEIRVWNIEKKQITNIFKTLDESRDWLAQNYHLEYEIARFLL